MLFKKNDSFLIIKKNVYNKVVYHISDLNIWLITFKNYNYNIFLIF